jgi:4'-phosphopantetheinyl transferase
VVLQGPPNSGEAFSLTVHLNEDAYDIDIDGLSGPLMRVRGFALIDRGPIPEPERFDEPEGGRPSCFPESDSAASPKSSQARASTDDQASAFLTEGEIADLSRRGTARRIADRIAGRIAAKRALTQLTGVAPLNIRVPTAASGEPIAEVPGQPGVSVSISHRQGQAVAVAVRAGRVGVDLEQVEARPAHFAEMWFHDDERRLAGSDLVLQTALWSVKEAVLKALGTGMALSPHQVRVVALGGGRAEVRLLEQAQTRLDSLGGGVLSIRWIVDGTGELMAEVRLAA